jgi:hypothetical protein
MKRWLVLFTVLLISAGCMTAIDRDWATLNAKVRAGNLAFVKASENVMKEMDRVNEALLTSQTIHVERDWDTFYAENIVDGMLPADAAKARYDQAIADTMAIEKDRQAWLNYKAAYLGVASRLKATIVSSEATEEQIMKAKESAQAYLDAAITTIGIVAGATIVP